LNTACRATFKNGTTMDFNTIDEASEYTKLSVASIKIRCNKPGCGGKDKTYFEWLDEHTKRSYQAKKSRNKGRNYELEIINDLKLLGFSNLSSTRASSRMMDNAKIDIYDPNNELSCYIQCKATKNVPQISKINEECSYKDKPLAIFWKKQDSTEKLNEFVVIPKEYFYKLISHEKENN